MKFIFHRSYLASLSLVFCQNAQMLFSIPIFRLFYFTLSFSFIFFLLFFF